jgi:hypothetical protein
VGSDPALRDLSVQVDKRDLIQLSKRRPTISANEHMVAIIRNAKPGFYVFPVSFSKGDEEMCGDTFFALEVEAK